MPSVPEVAIVHPLVLLSVVDHYNRVAKDTSKRVVGALLGSVSKGRVDVSGSFAVPFEEDARDPSTWYLDCDFLDLMFKMFKKVNAKEKIVGFYSTGPKIRANDLDIDDLFRKRCGTPLLVIVDVRPDITGVPTQAYYSFEQVDDAKQNKRSFRHIDSVIEAYEAEEVGVEHLLRDINDPTISTLEWRVNQKVAGLRGLAARLEEMHSYLEAVQNGELPVNNQILYNMQDILNLLPNLNVENFVKAFFVNTNDMHLVIYVSSLIRSILALHNLLNNKFNFRDYEEKKSQISENAASTNNGDTTTKQNQKKKTVP